MLYIIIKKLITYYKYITNSQISWYIILNLTKLCVGNISSIVFMSLKSSQSANESKKTTKL